MFADPSSGRLSYGRQVGPDRHQATVKRTKRKMKEKQLKIGTWNVRTMKDTGKLYALIKELEVLDLDILGISETRWSGSGQFDCLDSTIMYSGTEERTGQSGVAIIVRGKARNSVISFNPISDRILVMKLCTKPVPTTIIQVYAPTTSHDDESVDRFYEKLQSAVDQMKHREPCILMGDFNAKVGEGAEFSAGIGHFGLGTRNERGQRLADFSTANNLSILNTQFNHHKRRRFTWTSPDQSTRNQIDYMMINNNWRSSVVDARTKPSADCDTDHKLVYSKVQLKAFRVTRNSQPFRFNLNKLKYSEFRDQYVTETNNRFAALMMADSTETEPNDLWSNIAQTLRGVATDVLGRAPRRKVADSWIGDETIKLIQDRREARRFSDDTFIKKLNKKIKKSLRKDKKIW